MLIRFSIQNWMSFKGKETFSMIASKERSHRDRVPVVANYDFNVVPVAAIYGGNASGKTNLFKGLHFVHDMIVEGVNKNKAIPVEPYRLDAKSVASPSVFCIEVLVENHIYEFSFSTNKTKIISEKLTKISTKSERVLYERQGDQLQLDDSLSKQSKKLQIVFEGTRENQLFLNNSVSQRQDAFKPVHDWFEKHLQLVTPQSRHGGLHWFLKEDNPYFQHLNGLLSQLDTGISAVQLKEIPADQTHYLHSLFETLGDKLNEGEMVVLPFGPTVVTRKDGNLALVQINTFHSDVNGENIEFGIEFESDGSRRVIDLLPALIELTQADSKAVYVVDELDRSLHTLLTRHLLKLFLSRCSSTTRAQLLFTTHDVCLMDQQLLRRDEMWVTERKFDGSSTLTSFSDFKGMRNDKNIINSYLQGRLGGLPRL
ncbi:MAG: ATP-binding protein [Cyanobacteria bacterium]|nr:ATP-binding protein [Cyanobacteriota bacterium]